jgi:hypothetical protein
VAWRRLGVAAIYYGEDGFECSTTETRVLWGEMRQGKETTTPLGRNGQRALAHEVGASLCWGAQLGLDTRIEGRD